MTRYNFLHVDHVNKFEDLFLEFITLKNITYSDKLRVNLKIENLQKNGLISINKNLFYV